MSQKHSRTFQKILEAVGPSNGRALAKRARSASWLAKAYPRRRRTLYGIKNAAICQLFRIPGFEPVILDAVPITNGKILLSLKLMPTSWLLHLPLDRPDTQTRMQHKNRMS